MMKRCPKCGEYVPSLVDACDNCGMEFDFVWKDRSGWYAIGLLVVLFLALAWRSGFFL